MVKQLFRDTLVYGLARFISFGASLFILPVYTRVFAPAAYGAIDILSLMINLLNLTLALEIAQALARFLPDLITQRERISYSSTVLWFTVGVYGLFLPVIWALAEPVSAWLLNDRALAHAVRAAALAAWGTGVYGVALNQLRWQLQPRAFAVTSILYTVVYLASSVFLVVVLQVGVAGVFWGQVIAGGGGIALALYFARRDYGWAFNWRQCREMLRFSVPLVPSSVAVFIFLYIDRFVISRLLTFEDLGIFGIGYRVASVVSLLMYGFQGALTPLIYTYYAQPDTPRDLARIFRYFAAAALVVWTSLALFGPEVLTIFTTPAYYGAVAVISPLVLAILLFNLYIFAPGLAIAKKTGLFAAINIAGAGLNCVLNLMLVPALGIQGAALATLTSAAAMFGLHMFWSQRYYPVPHRWGGLLLAVAVAGGVQLASAAAGFAPWSSLPFKVMLVGVAAAAMIVLRLVMLEEIARAGALLRRRLAELANPPKA